MLFHPRFWGLLAALLTVLPTSDGTAWPARATEPTPGALNRYTAEERLMGMDFHLTFYAPDEPTANRASKAVFARIKQLNGVLSDYDPESELRRLSATAGSGKDVAVSADLFTVLAAGQELSQASDGAFDLTVGPLVQLWRKSRRAKQLPPDEFLEKARLATGFRHLQLDAQKRTVRLAQPGMQLDCGGIAVGYALDEGLTLFRTLGIHSAMIDGSGDIAVSDPPPGEPGWRIGVAPLEPEGPASQTLLLKHCAVTTSGDAWQHVEIDGVRYSHIVDTRTGLGLTTHSSVTVIAPTGIAADSYATAACVLGPQAGTLLLEKTPSAAGLFLTESKGTTSTTTTSRWSSFLAPASQKPNTHHEK